MMLSRHRNSHLRPVLWLFIILQALLFAPRLNSDGAYYYEYLRSLALQHDLNFDDEREFYTWEWVPVIKDFISGGWEETGYPPNIFSVGPALVWLPFFLIGHMTAHLLNFFGAGITMTGYGLFHRIFPMTASMLSGLITLLIIDRIGRDAGLRPEDRAGGILVFFGASNYAAFLFVTPAFSHSASVLFVSLFFWLWFRTGHESASWYRFAVFGITGGLAALARWQNLFCLILPLIDCANGLWIVIRKKHGFRSWLGSWTAFAVALVVTLIPQLLVTRALYGLWVTDPQGEGGMHWLSPSFRIILFDGIKGLFTVNPVLLPAVAAIPFLWRKNRRMTWGLLLLLMSQTYINAVRRDWAGVGFGMRRFLNLAPVFAVGLMVLFSATGGCSRRRFRQILYGIGALLTIWNLLLMGQYYLSELGAPWIEMSTRQMITGQLTTAPACLADLVSSSLFPGILRGDITGFILGGITLLITLAVFHILKRNDNRSPDILIQQAGSIVPVFGLVWLCLIGWLLGTIHSARAYHIPEFNHPGTGCRCRLLKLNPETGYQGSSGSILMGPGDQWCTVNFRPEYDRNRFLASGNLIPVPGVVEHGDYPECSLSYPVDVDAIELISNVDTTEEMDDVELVIAEIVLIDIDGSEIRLPVRLFEHTACSETRPPLSGTLIERHWPALHPMESGIRDTRFIYQLTKHATVRTIRLVSRKSPVVWRIRGLALRSPEDTVFCMNTPETN
ncbi:hypothetical protein JW823_03230 [bacterium]|nr:hypothetical protein [candidate division CSSED10-310 bacterium]